MSNSSKLDRRLAAYGSMSLALAAVSVPSVARASEVTWSADISTANGPAGAIYFDLATGYAGYTSTSSLDFELYTEVTSNQVFKARIMVSPNDAFANGNMFAASASLFGGSASSVARLSPGAAIGPNLVFSSVAGTLADGEYPYFGHWNSKPVTADIGLLFDDGGIRYGWVNITVNSDYTVTLNELAFDDTGNSILAGPATTPEPSSLILLTLGAAGLAAWRKKKQGRNSAAPVPLASEES